MFTEISADLIGDVFETLNAHDGGIHPRSFLHEKINALRFIEAPAPWDKVFMMLLNVLKGCVSVIRGI